MPDRKNRKQKSQQKTQGMVTHLASIACVRLVKMAYADMVAGMEIRPLVEQIGGADLALELPSWSYWRRQHPLISHYIMQAAPGDIWHCHGEPNGLAAAVRMGSKDAVIVLDVHDAHWGLGDQPTSAELEDLEAADAVIVPSPTYAKRCPKPACVVYSGCIGGRVMATEPHIGGVVYEGGIDVGGWRDYRDVARKFQRHGVPFAIYSHAAHNHEIVAAYAECGVTVRHCEYRSMLSELARYDWALVAPPQEGCAAYGSSWPNKYAESLQAGLPALCVGIDDVQDHIASHGCGYNFLTLDALVMHSKTCPQPSQKLRESAYAAAESLSMQHQIANIQKVYDIAKSNAATRRNNLK
jgi:hypothetical protein